jgi:hypothetical protein
VVAPGLTLAVASDHSRFVTGCSIALRDELLML